MMTLRNYQPRQPVVLDGPHRKPINFKEFLVSALAHIAIGSLLAYSILGMAGVWE